MRKKVDSRVRTIVENGVKLGHRSLFVIVGDKGRDQVVNLHYMLCKATAKTRPSVLWCYKKELGFTSHQKKRMRQIQKEIKRGIRDADEDNPFELFLSSTEIRYCYYKDSHKILGNTFGCLVLQDFEALTPNLLARTVETVEGGGLIILLLKTMSSLKQLFTITMDVHSRFRTESHQDVVARFNERFILSLSSCKQCLVVDDELNILPISSSMRNLKPVAPSEIADSDKELADLKDQMRGTEPAGPLVAVAKTMDQGKSILAMLDAVADKTLQKTVTLTAARGRGKSAALGLSIAGAVAYGYSNIFVTAPSPENLKTVFEMVIKGFDVLHYKDHVDYEIVKSTNPDLHDVIVRINVFRDHRQTIQYISPADYAVLGQAELVVIDEAAAIPLPIVKKLLGPYLVFISSTVNGYEGTGRSLSLKLFKQLREQTVGMTPGATVSSSGRSLTELAMQDPIRYQKSDPVEAWLNNLLCLDCTGDSYRILNGTPHPSKCDLYYVNRDTLFSYHKASEEFLQRIMSLFVSSHYKNTPNDLQLLSDAPAHHLFVLLGPVSDPSKLPDILAAIQVCLEGEISKESVKKSLARGEKASGDLIPWTISQQFQDYDFPSLSGARIVRIASHPDVQRMGYGSRALEILQRYYQGEITNLNELVADEKEVSRDSGSDKSLNLLEEELVPRENLPPLLEPLAERAPENLQFIGTSFGVTQELFNFWRRNQFKTVYLRQTPNDLTGEHTCIMLKSIASPDSMILNASWLDNFTKDFHKRFISLLSYGFKSFSTGLGLSILEFAPSDSNAENCISNLNWDSLSRTFSDFDIRRLDSYSRNLVDYHMILDLVPQIAVLSFQKQIPIHMSYSQAAILLGVGLQRKTISDLEVELKLQSNQILAAFNKAVKKAFQHFKAQQESFVRASLPEVSAAKAMNPLRVDLEQDLKSEGDKVVGDIRARSEKLLAEVDLQQYAIRADDADWESALPKNSSSVPAVIGVKSKRTEQTESTHQHKRSKHHDGKKKSKKKTQK